MQHFNCIHVEPQRGDRELEPPGHASETQEEVNEYTGPGEAVAAPVTALRPFEFGIGVF